MKSAGLHEEGEIIPDDLGEIEIGPNHKSIVRQLRGKTYP